MKKGKYYSAAKTAKDYGHPELVEKPALKAIEELKNEGKDIKAREAADIFGITDVT